MGRHIAIVIMGPCGCGKSEIGKLMSVALNCPFVDADDLHPEPNIAKMKQGVPLDDNDRLPWLETVRGVIQAKCQDVDGIRDNPGIKGSFRETVRPSELKGKEESVDLVGEKIQPGVVVACSALKKSYRDIIRANHDATTEKFKHTSQHRYENVLFVYLSCDKEILELRLRSRASHFMKESMLRSQLETLEVPQSELEPDSLVVNANGPVNDVVHNALRKIYSILM